MTEADQKRMTICARIAWDEIQGIFVYADKGSEIQKEAQDLMKKVEALQIKIKDADTESDLRDAYAYCTNVKEK